MCKENVLVDCYEPNYGSGGIWGVKSETNHTEIH
jgi:hypothetical protein